MISAHPLQWPVGWKRCAGYERKRAAFTRHKQPLTIAAGVERVLDELQRMGYSRDDVVISTNVETRLDGLPRSDRAEPMDPGAAVYWQTSKREHRVIAIDVYDRVADNLGAVAATLEAMRAIERHGGAVVLERAFTGFTALPAPSTWRDVLDFPPQAVVTLDMVRDRYRRLASDAHPDRPGGSHTAMAALNQARDAALLECRP
jgi:hypothetical protein